MNEARRLPTFIIGGAPRSGTTLLCHLLDQHPDVFMMKPYVPEPKVLVMPISGGPGEYHHRYDTGLAGANGERARGEKTSCYLEHADVPGRIADILGSVRLLFVAREPVQRAYSNYLRTRQNGYETLMFEEAIELEGAREDPFGPGREYVRPFDYLGRGRYATFAERYYARFGHESVKFVLYEDFERRPRDVMTEIQEFVGVEPIPLDAQALGRINAACERPEAIEPALESRLRDRMQDEVRRFAAITGLDVSVWGY